MIASYWGALRGLRRDVRLYLAPLRDLPVKVRVPEGKTVESVSLLFSYSQ